MKKVAYIAVAVAVIIAAIALGLKVNEKAGEDAAERRVKSEVERQIRLIKSEQPKIFSGSRGKLAEKSYRKVLEQQVRVNELIKKEALARGIKVAAKEVEAAVDQVRRSYGPGRKFAAALKKQGLTLAEYKDRIEDQILLSKLAADLGKGVKATEAEVRAFYERNKALFGDKPLEEVADLVKERVLQEKRQAELSNLIEKLREKVGR